MQCSLALILAFHLHCKDEKGVGSNRAHAFEIWLNGLIFGILIVQQRQEAVAR